MQNWAELGTLQSIRHLVVTVHMQWAGFEVGGTDAEVVRYWFSVLQERSTWQDSVWCTVFPGRETKS